LPKTRSRWSTVKPQLGVMVPNCALSFPWATAEGLIDLAKLAEELEFDSVWCNHHITPPKYLENLSPRPKFFDPLITLSFVASATTEIRLGTAVLVPIYRDPISTAMQVSALDTFSKGRLILGVGTGAYSEEFEAFHPGVPASKRGKIMDEHLSALRELLTNDVASFDGQFIKFRKVEMRPKPLQKPFPIWMAGNAPVVQKRAGLYGQGWLPAALSASELMVGAERMKGYAKEAGRNPSEIQIAPQWMVCLAATQQEALRIYKESLGYRHVKSLQESTLKRTSEMMMKEDKALTERNIIGTPDDAIRQMQTFIDAGATSFTALAFTHTSKSFDEIKAGWKLFAREVMPSFR
jgi:probable F420-dependent oxidoreductase